MGKPSDQYSPQETQRRFMAALKSAVNTPPKPLSEMKRGKPRAKQGKSLGTKDKRSEKIK